MPDDSAKKDDQATKSSDAAKKTEGTQEKPISDADAQAVAGGLSSIKWDKK